jgi:hypothetical protein
MPTASSEIATGDGIDRDLGEAYYKGDIAIEERSIDDIIDVIRRAIDKRFQAGEPARRDAHAFDTGCVRAVFRVDNNLHPDLRQGVFVPGAEYPAWIRFSNGNFVRGSARSPDARGMAIKLMNVPGPKILEDEKHTQDFILISHPNFFIDDLTRYKATLERFLRGGFWNQWVAAPLQLGSLRAIAIAFSVNARFITNPLSIQYWSMTPYRLGMDPPRKLAVKYTAKPSPEKTLPLYRRLATYFRRGFSPREQLNRRLVAEGTWFDFYIQRRVDHRTPIEDSTIKWREKVSRPEHVATIIIPSQQTVGPGPDQFCENLSFSPWHCLAEHKPLGLVNRVRKRVYLTISEYRHALNKVPRFEPTGAEKFD